MIAVDKCVTSLALRAWTSLRGYAQRRLRARGLESVIRKRHEKTLAIRAVLALQMYVERRLRKQKQTAEVSEWHEERRLRTVFEEMRDILHTRRQLRLKGLAIEQQARATLEARYFSRMLGLWMKRRKD
jgi:hypothetical protein